MPDAPPELIIVGRVRKAHGVRGALVVESITDAPDAVFAPGRRLIAGTVTGDPAPGRPELHVTSAEPFKGGFIVQFAEIGDRNAADTWRERFFLLPADELPPLADDELYVHELLGMSVLLETGEPVGTVTETYALPQGLTLDVARGAGASSVLVPYDRVVTRVDRTARVIHIAPPLGLLD